MKYIQTYESIRNQMTPVSKDKVSEFIRRFDSYSEETFWGKRKMIVIIKDNFTDEDIQQKLDEFIDPMDMMIWTSDKGNYGQVYMVDKLETLDKKQLKELFNRLIGRTNESVKSLMTPKTQDEIIKSFGNIPIDELLMNGVKKNELWLVKYALDNGANIHTGYMKYMKREDDDSPLMWAIEEGNIPMIKYLIERGADVNARDGAPLNAAATTIVPQKKTFQIIDILISAGADVHANNNGAYRSAKMYGELGIMNYLQSYMDKTNESVRDTNGVGFLRSKMIPKSDEDIINSIKDYPKEELEAMLRKSVIGKNMKMIKILLDMGVDSNSGLLHAISGTITSNPSLEVIEMLLKAGADPMKPGKNSKVIPMRHAIHWNPGPIVDLLKKYVKE